MRNNRKLLLCAFALVVLLIVSSLSGCAQSEDPAIEFYKHLEFDYYDKAVEDGWYEAEQVERIKLSCSWHRDNYGDLIRTKKLSEDDYRSLCLTRPAELPLDDSGRYSVEVLDFPYGYSVHFRLHNHSDEELPMPRYCAWDVQINGEWYWIFDTREANRRNPDSPFALVPELLERVPPGESQEQTIWDMIRASNRLPGHYRICLSHDGDNWVVTEFDITEEDYKAAEMQVDEMPINSGENAAADAS